jgi:NADH-quinone oxidoreductase subunit J
VDPEILGRTAFYYLAAASVASAILAVTRRNPVHSMLWVLALFLHVAGIFLLVGAEFLAAVQVIVYAGAILVFYLFFLMLLDLPREAAGPRFGSHWPLCAAAGLAFAALAWYARDPGLVPTTAQPLTSGGPPPGNLRVVGRALFTQFALPFEIASLILLAAIVGAVVVAKRKTDS